MIDPTTAPDAAAGASAAAGGRRRSPAALAAFLRGVERRGAVLAELQCGDAAAGDAALADAMTQFQQDAGSTVMDDWPRRFWSLLLAQPALKSRTPVAIAVDATDRLGELGSGPRAALLLRLAAGLDEADAAAVLGVRSQTYRLALQRSLPHHPDGRADPGAWQALREQVHRRIKTLPAGRLDRLATAREAALRGSDATEPVHGASAHAATIGRTRPRWLMPLLWALLALCVVGMLMTFLPQFSGHAGGAARVLGNDGTLPDQAPASRYSVEAAAVTHRDFELLADPEGVALAADMPFHAWLAAHPDQLPAVDPRKVGAVEAAPVTDAMDTVGGETSDGNQ